ncbi:RICIN domain-containing protein, partial [Streptomyces sp. WM6378]|uniref:RICIN domain-containing protein n=1 Tax=Streptomyces sp. WM6378 TaxID=1415557 RepID=UPI0006C182CE
AGVYRSALGVVRQADNTLFASIHASASGGTDAASLVRRVATRSRQLALGNWVVLGDFNRAPRSLPVGGTTGIPANAHIYENGGPTQLSGGRLDYAVSNVLTQNWQAARGNPRGSDHWPITFSALRAGAGPARFTLGDNGGNGGVLDVYQARKANGTHIILYHPDNGTNQQWTLRPDGYQNRSNRIVSVNSGKCMDVDNGTASREGSQMNIWDCHRHGPTTDTQNFVLEHPMPLFPNLTTITNERTEYLLNIAGNGTADGTPRHPVRAAVRPPSLPRRQRILLPPPHQLTPDPTGCRCQAAEIGLTPTPRAAEEADRGNDPAARASRVPTKPPLAAP